MRSLQAKLLSATGASCQLLALDVFAAFSSTFVTAAVANPSSTTKTQTTTLAQAQAQARTRTRTRTRIRTKTQTDRKESREPLVAGRRLFPPASNQLGAAQKQTKTTPDRPQKVARRTFSAGAGAIDGEEEEEEEKMLMSDDGLASMGEREKRSKKRRRKKVGVQLLLLLLFAFSFSFPSLVVGLATPKVDISTQIDRGQETGGQSLLVISARPNDEAKSDILETALKLAANISGGGQTDSYNDSDMRRQLSENEQHGQSEGQSENESESDTDSSDNDNETDNGSENDNDGSTTRSNNGNGNYNDGDGDGDDNTNATTTATAWPSIRGKVTRVHNGHQPEVAAETRADEDSLDDSADDYNDYGAYVIYEHEDLDEPNSPSSSSASNATESSSGARYASLTAGFDGPHQAAAQVFYASRRLSSSTSEPSPLLDDDKQRKGPRRRDNSNQRHWPVSNWSTLPLRDTKQQPTTRMTSENVARHVGGNEKEEDEDEDEDAKWLDRMMMLSGTGSASDEKQTNQKNSPVSGLLEIGQQPTKQQQRDEEAEITNKSFHWAIRQQQYSSLDQMESLRANSTNRDNTRQFPETTIEHDQQGPAHNVYYWRLIWFVLPVGATFGNLLVIMAVYLEKSLQSVTNYFIVSLAFADLFVGLVVMPFAVYVLVNEVWELSDSICDIYVAVDVTSSTASILNLVAISIDRYRAVAHPLAYSARTSNTRAILTILFVWFISCCVGAPIILGLNTSPERKSSLCILYNSTFIFWSSLTSFYVPCIIMIGLYWRIFLAIRSRTKKAIQAGSHAPSPAPTLAAVAHHLHHPSSSPALALAVGTTAAIPTSAPGLTKAANLGPSSQAAAVTAATNQQQSNLFEANEIILSGAKLQTAAQVTPPSGGQQPNGEQMKPAAAAAHQSISARPHKTKLGPAFASTFARQPTKEQTCPTSKPAAGQSKQRPASELKGRQVNGSGFVGPPSLFPGANGRASSEAELVALAATTTEIVSGGVSHPNDQLDGKVKGTEKRGDQSNKATPVCPLAKWNKTTTKRRPNQLLIDKLLLVGRHQQEHQANASGGKANESENENGSSLLKGLTLVIERPPSCACCNEQIVTDGCGDKKTCSREFFIPKVMRFSQEMSYSLLGPNKINHFCDDGRREDRSNFHSSASLESAATVCPTMLALLSLSFDISNEQQQLVKVRLSTDLSLSSKDKHTWVHIEFRADDFWPRIKQQERSQSAFEPDLGLANSIEEYIREIEHKLESLVQHSDQHMRSRSSVLEFVEILQPKCQALRANIVDTNKSCDFDNRTCCGCCGTKLMTGDGVNVWSQNRDEGLANVQSVCVGFESQPDDDKRISVNQLSAWSRAEGFEQPQIYRGATSSSSSSSHRITWLHNKNLKQLKFRLRVCNETDRRLQLCGACNECCLIGLSLSFYGSGTTNFSLVQDQNHGELFRPMGKLSVASQPLSAAAANDGPDVPAPFRSSSWALIDSQNFKPATIASIEQSDAKRKSCQMSLAECANLSKLLEEERLRQIKCRSIGSSNGSRVNYCASYADDAGEDDDDDDDDDEEDDDDDEEDDDDNGLARPAMSRCRSVSRSSSQSSTEQSDDGDENGQQEEGRETNSFASSRTSLSSGSECSTTGPRNRRNSSRRSSHPSCCQPSPTCFACQQHQKQKQSKELQSISTTTTGHQSGDLEFASCQHPRASLTEVAPTSGSYSRKNTFSATTSDAQDGAGFSLSRAISSKRAARERPTSPVATMSVIQSATLKLKRRSMRLGKFLKQTTLKTADLAVESQAGQVGSAEAAQTPAAASPQATQKNQSSDDPFSSSVLATNAATNALLSASPSNFSVTNNQIVAVAISHQATSSTSGSSQTAHANQSTTAGGVSLMSPSTSLLVGGRTVLDQKQQQLDEEGREQEDDETKSGLDGPNSCSKNRSRRSKTLRGSCKGEEKESLEHKRQQRRDIKRSFLVASVINLIQQQQQQQNEQKANQKKGQRAKKAAESQIVAVARQHRAGGSRRRREKNAARRERKATKTLAIVLGIFLICWTPFFTCNVIDGICIQLNMDCRPGMMVYLVTSWLGYINSCVNPIIYTIFNMEFRRAFKRILTSISCC